MQDTRLVRTCVDGDSHTLVLRQTTGETSPLGLLYGDDPTDVVAVTRDAPGQFLEAWRDRIGRRPRNLGVVSAGDQMRSVATACATDRNVVRAVPTLTDAEQVREATVGYLDAWPTDGQTVVYFDSITTLLDRLDADETVDVLANLCRMLDTRGADGYFCLTPSAHSRETVRTVASLFDTVVECVANAAEASSEPSVSDCFDAIADSRRRYLLGALVDRDAVPVAELADRVATRQSVDRQQVAASLVDVHLPKLVDLGMVTYDCEGGRVAPGEHFERVEPYLQQAIRAE